MGKDRSKQDLTGIATLTNNKLAMFNIRLDAQSAHAQDGKKKRPKAK